MDCLKEKEDLVFNYKVKLGSLNKSFGIGIIRKLGFPLEII